MRDLAPFVRGKQNSDGLTFVDYADETMGNAVGVSAGYALTSDKFTWVNTSDASLQMGTVMESLLHYSQISLKGCSALITVDNNEAQVTGFTSDINSIEPVLGMIERSNMTYHLIKDIDYSTMLPINHDLKAIIDDAKNPETPAVCIVFNTIKGFPFKPYMENVVESHYTKIDDELLETQLKRLKEVFHAPSTIWLPK